MATFSSLAAGPALLTTDNRKLSGEMTSPITNKSPTKPAIAIDSLEATAKPSKVSENSPPIIRQKGKIDAPFNTEKTRSCDLVLDRCQQFWRKRTTAQQRATRNVIPSVPM